MQLHTTEPSHCTYRGDKSFVTDLNGGRPDWYWTGKAPDYGCPGMKEDGKLTHLPLPKVNCSSRQEILDYFDNVWTITEVLFSGLQGKHVCLPNAFKPMHMSTTLPAILTGSLSWHIRGRGVLPPPVSQPAPPTHLLLRSSGCAICEQVTSCGYIGGACECIL